MERGFVCVSDCAWCVCQTVLAVCVVMIVLSDLMLNNLCWCLYSG